MPLPEKFVTEFAGPNAEYRPQLMWFWDAPLEEEELRRQVRGFHEQGIVTFFVHPMFGFPVDYLGAEMLQALGWAIDEAKRYDMRFWIYDEYNWPSGVAGCYVIKDQLERRQLILVKSEWKAGEEAPQLEGRLVGRYEKEGQMTDFWEVPQGGVCPFAQWSPFCWDQEGYADICDAETTKAFLDYTFDRYQGAFGEDFGKTLGGVFTDEASYCIAGPYGQSYSPIAWSHGFGEEFLRRYGYDITTQLVSLFEQVGEWRKVRLDYWRLLTDLLSINYYKQYAERCDELGIQLTGHVSGEEHFRWQLLMYGDPWLTLKWMHQPGIDSIFPRMNHDADYFMTAAKMGSAVLRYSGRERLLCETYTGSGWELTPADMKLICDKLVLGGVNLIQYMGAYYSVAGMRKVLLTGYPPSHSFQQAWWPYYHLFGDYVGRLCHTLVATKPTAKIGLVYPTSTAYVEWQGTAADLWGGAVSPERLERFQLVFHALTNVLLELGFDYEYLFEEVFAQGQVAEGVLKVANAQFDTLIVPAATALPAEVARRLAEFAATGGQVVFVNYLPEWADGDSEALALVEALTGQPGEAANTEVDARINAGAGTEIKENGKVYLACLE